MTRVDQLCQEIYRTPPNTDRRADLLRQLAALNDLGAAEAYRAAMALGAEGAPEFVQRACTLAYLAHSEGYPNAGALYAHCVDRLCLLRHELPKFGINRWECDGDVLMPQIDNTISDAQRVALGLPAIGAVSLELDLENRHRAEERYAVPLAEGVHLRRVWRKWSADELRPHLPVRVEGEDITFIYEGEAAEVRMIGGLQMPLWRIPESRLWALTVRVRNLAEAVISYGFLPAGGPPPGLEWPEFHQWRGPQAPEPPRRVRHLAGQVMNDEVGSPALGGSRGLSVYLPPDHDPDVPTPVVYVTDGQGVISMAAVLDPLIAAGKVPPVLLIGAHNAGASNHELRSREYLPGHDNERFEAHRQFFREEIPLWAEMVLGADTDPRRRAVFGCSSGANFALAMGVRHSDFFGNVIAFSVAGRMEGPPAWPEGVAPRHYLVAGTLETGFAQRTRRYAQWLATLGVDYAYRERVFGHDAALWEEELPQAIAWAFGSPGAH